jgi:Tripartite tricarboxylate transporter family receptor
MKRREFVAGLGSTTALSVAPRIGMAQTYPSRPVTMLVPYGAGGATDTTGRIVAEGVLRALGQPIIIENVVGASGTIGVGRVARTAPDGYTFLLGGFATHVLNGPMFAFQYDLIEDFEAVSLISSEPLMIVARKTLRHRPRRLSGCGGFDGGGNDVRSNLSADLCVVIGHLIRLQNRWPVQLGPFSVPMSVSWAGLVIALVLSIWGFMQLANSGGAPPAAPGAMPKSSVPGAEQKNATKQGSKMPSDQIP